MKPCENDTKAPCRGALLGVIKDVFTPRVLFERFSFPYVPILVWSRVRFSRELLDCMNVFMVSIPNKSERNRKYMVCELEKH